MADGSEAEEADKEEKIKMLGFLRNSRSTVGIFLGLLVVVVAGCATEGGPQSGANADDSLSSQSEFSDGADTQIGNELTSGRVGFDFGTIYFGFNRAIIAEDARLVLDSAGAALARNDFSIVIEGHCDEVGSDEYNLALGELRAEAVRRYLFNLGVSNERMEIVSYGESRPALQGSGETVWRLNRRAEIKVQR